MVKIITGVPKLPGEEILNNRDKLDTVEKVTRFLSGPGGSGLFDYLTEREKTKQEREKTERFKELAKVKKEEIKSWRKVELARIKAEREANRLRLKKVEIKSEKLTAGYEIAISMAQSPEERMELFKEFTKSVVEL